MLPGERHEPVLAELFVRLVADLGDAVGEEDQAIPRPDRDPLLEVHALGKHSEHGTPGRQALHLPVAADQHRRVVAGVGKRQRAELDVHDAVSRMPQGLQTLALRFMANDNEADAGRTLTLTRAQVRHRRGQIAEHFRAAGLEPGRDRR